MATTAETVRAALDVDTIAVVGCSATPGKDAHGVPRYLLDHGYDLIPVNPFHDEIFGRPSYDTLADVDRRVDLVNVFRPSDEVAGIVDQALARDDVRYVWLQLGIHDDAAVDRARAAGLGVVQDKCIMIEHRRLR